MWSALKCLNKIQFSSLMNTRIRHYMKTSEKMALLLKQADHVPLNYELVYRLKSFKMGGIMYHSVHFIVLLTFTSAGYHVYKHGFNEFNGLDVKEKVPNAMKVFTNPYQIVILGLANIAMIVIASIVRKRYAIRVYYNEKNKMFRAIFIGKIPFTIEQSNFPAASVTYVSRDSILPWKNSLFNANGRKILLFEENFRTQSDFYAMLHPEEIETQL